MEVRSVNNKSKQSMCFYSTHTSLHLSLISSPRSTNSVPYCVSAILSAQFHTRFSAPPPSLLQQPPPHPTAKPRTAAEEGCYRSVSPMFQHCSQQQSSASGLFFGHQLPILATSKPPTTSQHPSQPPTATIMPHINSMIM